jgi:hypothetical protein
MGEADGGSSQERLLSVSLMKQSPKRQFAICIRADYPDLLTPRRIYDVGERKGEIRSLSRSGFVQCGMLTSFAYCMISRPPLRKRLLTVPVLLVG